MKIRNNKDLVAWIEANVKEGSEYGLLGCKTPQDAAIWFVAFQKAVEYHDSFMLKDWAEMLRDGIPSMEESDVDDHFNELFDGESDEFAADLDECTITELHKFFGIAQ